MNGKMVKALNNFRPIMETNLRATLGPRSNMPSRRLRNLFKKTFNSARSKAGFRAKFGTKAVKFSNSKGGRNESDKNSNT